MSLPLESGERALGIRAARKYGAVGVVLFVVGFVLGGVGNTVSGALWIVPYSDTLDALGFVLALFGAALAGSTIREIVIVGIIFGVGTFYVGEPHATHIGSGLGFGLEHMTHVFMGLGLVALATALSAGLSFYHTRTRRSA